MQISGMQHQQSLFSPRTFFLGNGVSPRLCAFSFHQLSAGANFKLVEKQFVKHDAYSTDFIARCLFRRRKTSITFA
jgi:hypothetical protein